MKVIELKRYQCERCKQTYDSEGDARRCEDKPVSKDRGAKVGDLVRILRGDGAGMTCKVESIGIHSMNWGPSIYWHTVFVNGKVVESWGNRQLSFDDYALIRE